VAFGVPLISHVAVFKVAQAGSVAVEALTAHPIMADPLFERVVGETVIAEPKVPEVPAAPE